MKIVILTGGGEPAWSSNHSLIYGFRQLGHEVVSIGPRYNGQNFCDVEIPDKSHPELYPYTEIIEKSPWTPDICLSIDPHGFLSGPKPKGVKSGFIAIDAHRAAELYQRMVLAGGYDYFFVAPAHFSVLFSHLPCHVIGIYPGFDERRFCRDFNIEQECDFTFSGQTGLANLEYPFHDECGAYADNSCLRKYFHMPPQEKFAFSGHPGYDYASRGEMLVQLSRYFDIRIYKHVFELPYYQISIQKGRIGFNRSLLGDTTLRCFEILAANRFLIADELPRSIFGLGSDSYKRFFKPFFANFQLEADYAARIISYRLDDMVVTKKLAGYGSDDVWNNHSWTRRAEEIIYFLKGAQ